MEKRNNQTDYEIVNERDYIWKTPNKIETVEAPTNVCPHCSTTLSKGFSLIPIGNGKKAKVPGLECKNCGILFISQTKPLRNLIQDNEHAKDITLNGKSLWNYSFLRKQEKQKEKRLKKIQEKVEILSQIKGSIMLVSLRNNGEQINCVITNDKKPTANENAIVTHYSSLLAREIITAVHHDPRTINLNSKEYKINRPYYPYDSMGRKQLFPIELMPSELRIKPGGGYYSSIKKVDDEVVDILLYSPFTQRYEIARATFNYIDDECFMDIGLFRSFIKKYGNPGVHLSFDESNSNGMTFDELRAESILHAYGYSVSESEGLTAEERHELLSEIVDLELLSIPYVVRLLDFFSRTHTSDKYINARNKWAMDMKFISNYKVNTKRFLILR